MQDKALSPEAHWRRSPLNVPTDRAAFHCYLDLLERILAVLHIRGSAEVLKDLERTQCLGFRIFEPALSTPSPSLHLHRQTKVVEVIGSV